MRTNQKYRFKKTAGLAALYFFLFCVSLLVILPFVWVLGNAFRPNAEIGMHTNLSWYTFFPNQFTVENFTRMFEQLKIPEIIANTLFVGFSVTLGSLLINSITAYAFARIRFKGRGVIFLVIISMLVLPIEVLIIPLYLTVVKLGISDSFPSLILPFLATPFGIFFMRQFFSSLPIALDEAAIIDGAGHFTIFSRIYLPLAKTPLFTLGLLTFLQQWDSFIVPVTFINDERKMLLQVALTRLSMGLYMTDYGVLYAGVALSVVPILIIYLIFQKNIVENVAATGIK